MNAPGGAPRVSAYLPRSTATTSTCHRSGTEQPLGFWKLPAGFDRELASWSSAGPVGYVEADFFGGVGSQRAALWVAGELVLGPLFLGEGEPFTLQRSPISQLLARLGVDRNGYRDEFEAVGLGRHRETADWLP